MRGKRWHIFRQNANCDVRGGCCTLLPICTGRIALFGASVVRFPRTRRGFNLEPCAQRISMHHGGKLPKPVDAECSARNQVRNAESHLEDGVFPFVRWIKAIPEGLSHPRHGGSIRILIPLSHGGSIRILIPLRKTEGEYETPRLCSHRYDQAAQAGYFPITLSNVRAAGATRRLQLARLGLLGG